SPSLLATAEKGFLVGRRCFYSMEFINGSYRWFSLLEIRHLDFIVGDDSSKAISLALGDIKRFIICTNCSCEGLHNLFSFVHIGYVSCDEAVCLLNDDKSDPIIFHQIICTITNKICRRRSSPVAHEVWNLSCAYSRN